MPRKKFYLTLLVFMFVLTIAIPSRTSASTTIFYVDPVSTGIDAEGKPLQPGATFSISIKIENVVDLVGWSFMLYWDPAILNVTNTKTDVVEGPFLKSSAPQGTFWLVKMNSTAAYIDVACGILGFVYGVDGSGLLATVKFTVMGTGETDLDLQRTKLKDHFVEDIPHVAEDGYFNNAQFHDVAVTNVTVSPTSIQAGDTVYINVTVENQGDFPETFNVTLYYDEHVIEERLNIALENKTSTILEFIWNTPSDLAGGDYTIKAVASFVPKEADRSDNTFIDGVVSIPEHDITVLNLTASPKQVVAGQTVSINVTVKNKGDFPETFNVTLYYDTAFLERKTVNNLQPNETEVLNFDWDTSGVPEDSYLLKAEADPVAGEVKIDDNTFVVKWDDAVEVTHSEQSLPIGIIGAAVGVIVVAVLAVAYTFRRRSKSVV